MKLFVYGSLLSGEGQHGRLMGSAKVRDDHTAPRYTLVDLGSHPAALEGGTTAIAGEVYEVDPGTVDALDAYEDHPALFERTRIELAAGDAAVAYLLRQKSLAQGRPIIGSGDWRRRSASPGRETDT